MAIGAYAGGHEYKFLDAKGITKYTVPGAMEAAIRPFETKVPKPWQARPEPDRKEGDAVLEWSAKMQVQVTTVPAMGWKVHWPDNDLSWIANEFYRNTSVRRVTNPEDSSQFVDVEVINSIGFIRDGRQERYNMKN